MKQLKNVSIKKRTMVGVVCWFLVTTTLQGLVNAQDLKSIFHIPSRRNYDELEIIERSSFGSDDSTSSATTSPTEVPRSYANAQVMVRFGSDPSEKGKCSCGAACQCKNQPYYVPVLTPLPYCLCVPPKSELSHPYGIVQTFPYAQTPDLTSRPEETKNSQKVSKEVVPILPYPRAPGIEENEKKVKIQDVNTPKENIVDETRQTKENLEINKHPKILETIELSEDSIRKIDDLDTIETLEEVSNKLEPSPKNVKTVDSDFNKIPKSNPKNELKGCLVPYTHPKLPEPKLLVSYPIFNRPEGATIVPVNPPSMEYQTQNEQYHSNPVQTIIYKEPTVWSVVPPQPVVTVGSRENEYILVPVIDAVPTSPTEDCCCCSCAKYVGELNEKAQ